MTKSEKMMVGGQAIIEGVMMRSPERVAMAVRRPDGKILLKNSPYQSLTRRNQFWGLPIVRGAVVLIESMVLGIKALTFSGDVAASEPLRVAAQKNKSGISAAWMIITIAVSLTAGLLLFFYLPLMLTDWLGARNGFWFNLIDGIIRAGIFIAYLLLIAMWKDVRRIFQYHGAEHKTIFAFEDGKELTIENSRSYASQHPRCGTSFILMVLFVSILVFMLLGRPETIADRLIRLALVPLIGGVSYELVKLSDRAKDHRLVQLFILPGLWLQRITAREPDESMLEVALVALKSSLGQQLVDGANVVLFEEPNP
ncbi:MAG: DUF1385 domain-containing protein [candidate division KSB1 bacterium]|nr:DUF1385 domain-containing protein [candidate division KSB1 bacterium]MDZ7334483.1 DUF1385 domain-containing protein [candidate division KSB1 bacterium]MDZ7356010.1 DUF1385 domain-containing protein [candidate division KSB1 bacterium]MDZ7400656.1 DUF1385 domain-containing protein [candidate division KSB1 bacterium]